MTYQEQLNPWIVQQQLPDLNRRVLARFRRRGEADAYAKTMKNMSPGIHLTVLFTVGPSVSDQAAV